jgi:hypothetical protein
MKEKLALLFACFIVSMGLGVVLYLFNITQSLKEIIVHCVVFALSMFLFELYIRPVINRKFKKRT